jgi:hypothetical protein
MSDRPSGVRGFKPVLIAIGLIYILLAGSMLFRGAGVMRDFAVPEAVVSAPVFQDFFMFFYQLMAVIGVLTIVLGYVTRERKPQVLVCLVFCAIGVFLTWRDVTTSDSALGNQLYRGAATLIPVYIDLAILSAFGLLAFLGQRPAAPRDLQRTG